MDFQVKLTHEAERNLEDIITYLDEEFGNYVVSDFKKRFKEFIILLAENPHLFPFYMEEKNIRRAVLIEEVSVYYRIRESVVQIITMLHNRRKSPTF